MYINAYTGAVGNPTNRSPTARFAVSKFMLVRNFRNLILDASTLAFPVKTHGVRKTRIPNTTWLNVPIMEILEDASYVRLLVFLELVFHPPFVDIARFQDTNE